MDIFSFRDKVVNDYAQFSRSFTQIKATDLQTFVVESYGNGKYWPLPLRFSTQCVLGEVLATVSNPGSDYYLRKATNSSMQL